MFGDLWKAIDQHLKKYNLWLFLVLSPSEVSLSSSFCSFMSLCSLFPYLNTSPSSVLYLLAL